MKNRRLGVLKLAALTTLLLIALRPAHAQTEIVLYNFCSLANCADGNDPASSLLPDGAGNFYGTTQLGGANNAGTVFELSPNGVGGYDEIVLYSFCSLTKCGDGDDPTSNLIFDSVGNLYGTACSGGANGQGVASQCGTGSSGYGVVFKLSPEPHGGCPSGSNSGDGWCETVLYSFKSNPDGAFPNAGLIRDTHGNFYGTTSGGGSGTGLVYELSPNGSGGWNESVLYSVCSQLNCVDGAYPNGLVQDTNGNFYGTTENGGAYTFGTVFELSPKPPSGCPTGSYAGNGWCDVIVHAFAGHPSDGSYPSDTPVLDSAGNIYGTTIYGGQASCNSDLGCGTVWKLSPAAGGDYSQRILHYFNSGPGLIGCCDPIRLPHYLWAGVVLDPSGNIYGVTAYGGSSTYCTQLGKASFEGCGTFFEIENLGGKKQNYKFDLLWVFNWSNGANPLTSLILDGGNLYGTTYSGGLGEFCPNPEGCGVAVELTP